MPMQGNRSDLGPKLELMPLQTVSFAYVNWRDEKHHYVIDVESFQLGPFDPGGISPDQDKRVWVLNGFVIERDGEKREGPNRRTFILDKIENLQVVT